MKLRHKKTGVEMFGSRFAVSQICEIVVGDDAVNCIDLDVFITANNEWVDLHQAFKNKDVITDNLDTFILEPLTEEDRKRGFIF